MKNKRLTYKLNEQEQEAHKTKYLKFEYFPIPDYCIEKGNYGRISSDMIYNKLGELEDIEQELGCPLDVVFRALKDGIYIEDNTFNTFEKYNVRGIELIGLSVINKICNYGECDFTCYYDEYKKKWWLKEDKSE